VRRPKEEGKVSSLDFTRQMVLPLLLHRGTRVWPIGGGAPPREGDQVDFVLFGEQLDRARSELHERGWRPAAVDP
jgi:hypothetical protein